MNLATEVAELRELLANDVSYNGSMKHVIVYSHGFGVDKTDRGLFSDIENSIPNVEHIMFDYNKFDEATNTMTVSPLNEQVRILKDQLEKLEYKNSTVDIVAHSQGCIVAALAKPKNVRNVICLAPPSSLDSDRMLKVFGGRPGAQINLVGTSKIPRRDGTTTLVPASYWSSIESLNVICIYNRLPGLAKTVFYNATDDEVLGAVNFDQTDQAIELVDFRGNHDFTGEHRDGLCKAIAERLK